MSKAFVFVVCGGGEHIDTLHFSLEILIKKTKHEVIVVTDTRRNEIPIDFSHVIDVATPDDYDHHQASIYLKTSLHRILPQGKVYAYLDTDIIAFGANIDDIFDQYIPPVTFAPDHCTMPFFSPSAVNCGCREEYDAFILQLNDYLDSLDPLRKTNDQHILKQRDLLKRTLQNTFSNKPLLILKGMQYLLSWPNFKLNAEFTYNRRTKLWTNKQGESIMRVIHWNKVVKKFNLKYRFLSLDIVFKNGRSIWSIYCDHLQEKIFGKFGVEVKDHTWQHWNGGVFLFNDLSHDFLETWHLFTREIFKDPTWKTRDQGTLIATAWKFGLEKHPLLDKKWNFICDYNNALLKFEAEEGTITDNGRNYLHPEFVHVYHHFGDKDWDFWNNLVKAIKL